MNSKLKAFVLTQIIIWVFNGFYIDVVSKRLYLFLGQDFITYVILPGIILLTLYKNGVSPKSYGIDFNKTYARLKYGAWLNEYLTWTLLIVIIWYLLRRTGIYYNLFSDDYWIQIYSYLDKSTIKYFSIYLAITASIAEEIFFRGLLYELFNSFAASNVNAKYILISSLIFAVSHFETGIYNVAISFLLGIIFSLLEFRVSEEKKVKTFTQ